MAVSKKKTRKSKKKKNNLIKKHITEVIVLSLIVFAIIFIIYRITQLAIKPASSFLIEQGKISQKETLTGYVIRDEKVIQAPEDSQKLVQIKNEGERVSVGEEVFRYEASNEQELNDKIDELNVQIQEALDSQANKPYSSDIEALETQIENKMDGKKDKNNIKEIKEYKKDINGYIVKKAKIAGDLSPAGSYINGLLKERSDIEKTLSNNSKYEKATISGIVSYRVDGLEEQLNPGQFDNLSMETLNSLDLITGQIVTTSDKNGKVINNFECYIAVSSNSNEARKAEKGDKLKILLSDNREIPATIEYIRKEDSSVFIILKITQSVEYLTNYRKISIDLVWWKEEGLRIPNSSIIYENGLSYVIRTKSGVLNKILVKVDRENDKYSIISNYTSEELKNMGYSAQEINQMRKISIYDEILYDPDLEKLSKELD